MPETVELRASDIDPLPSSNGPHLVMSSSSHPMRARTPFPSLAHLIMKPLVAYCLTLSFAQSLLTYYPGLGLRLGKLVTGPLLQRAASLHPR